MNNIRTRCALMACFNILGTWYMCTPWKRYIICHSKYICWVIKWYYQSRWYLSFNERHGRIQWNSIRACMLSFHDPAFSRGPEWSRSCDNVQNVTHSLPATTLAHNLFLTVQAMLHTWTSWSVVSYLLRPCVLKWPQTITKLWTLENNLSQGAFCIVWGICPGVL